MFVVCIDIGIGIGIDVIGWIIVTVLRVMKFFVNGAKNWLQQFCHNLFVVELVTTLDYLKFGKKVFSVLLLTLFLWLSTLKIKIADNELSGTIPIEVGLLTNLTALYLSKRPFSV